MKTRLIWTACAALVLLVFVISSQLFLERVATNLVDSAEEICGLLATESTEEGERKLEDLLRRFRNDKWVFFIFVNDDRVYELNRSLTRAQALAEEGEWSPSLEALSDFVSVLREIAQTHRPNLTNIF